VGLAALVAAAVLAATPVSFVQSHATAGAFAESGGTADAALTSWAVLGLRAAGAGAPGSLAYLQSQDASLTSTTDVALVALAEQALGGTADALLARLRAAQRPSGQVGATLNSTYWAVLALGHSSPATTRFMLAQQTKAGGFSWFAHGQPDSNDTAAALEALHVAGVHGPSSRRAVRFILTFENKDGGFEVDARPRLRRAVDGVGDPGSRRRRPHTATRRVRVPREAAPLRWQLSLLGEVRRDPSLGHVAGPGRAREEAVPVGLSEVGV